jgi:hypothetical protein
MSKFKTRREIVEKYNLELADNNDNWHLENDKEYISKEDLRKDMLKIWDKEEVDFTIEQLESDEDAD